MFDSGPLKLPEERSQLSLRNERRLCLLSLSPQNRETKEGKVMFLERERRGYAYMAMISDRNEHGEN